MKTVLAIDGGGIRGIVPSVVLQYIEERIEGGISDNFDLISGTSTGAIIACGLACPGTKNNNQPYYLAEDIVKFYEEKAPKIFEDKRNLIQRIYQSKYNNENLENVLKNNLGNCNFSEMRTNVMTPAYDIINMRPFFFKSWRSSINDVPSYKISSASSSAPTFFDPTRIDFQHQFEPRYYIDGAVAANNPAMAAYVEAKRLWPEENIFILSLGTGDYSQPVYKEGKSHWGITTWIGDIIDLVMDAPVNTVDYQLHTLNPDMYVRLQTRIDDASRKIDIVGQNNIDLLKEEAYNLIDEERYKIQEVIQFLREKA